MNNIYGSKGGRPLDLLNQPLERKILGSSYWLLDNVISYSYSFILILYYHYRQMDGHCMKLHESTLL